MVATAVIAVQGLFDCIRWEAPICNPSNMLLPHEFASPNSILIGSAVFAMLSVSRVDHIFIDRMVVLVYSTHIFVIVV